MSTSAKATSIQVDRVEYLWSVYRQPRWVSERGLLGLAILVTLNPAAGRELLLEFQPDFRRHRNMPQHQRVGIAESRLADCIQNAIAAGWDAHSRGKRFVFNAGPMKSN